MPSIDRRQVLKQSSLLAALATMGLLPATASAQANPDAFAAKSVADVLKALGAEPAANDEVQLSSPEIAENGAVVQVAVNSRVAGTQEIAVLVEKNPMPLVASFTIPAGTDPSVQLRAKMGQTTQVWALVKANGRWYSAQKETKVTLGGCGG
jgi:sulfur-oxidizing protein SoxY